MGCNAPRPSTDQQVMATITEPAAFIKTLLGNSEFQQELEEEDQRKWETLTLRLLAWDGESEELPEVQRDRISLTDTGGDA